MSRHLTIHGHFYQPPRENPWLEAVETQDSAAPWHDWNQRITAECYGPNAASRILDARDRILAIVNNYASISFNFGPTLLSWMEAAAPDTYRAVLEADQASQRRFGGHGNAIAQAYNHIILPLANARDKRTQVRWGVRDFASRFGRPPEGMWLPETAVDVDSLEALAAEGIQFTILEPHQAARWRRIGDEEWHDVNGGLDPTRVYRCNLPSGNAIDIFFYDGPISRAVAFEQLLARGENLAHRLVGAFSDDREHAQLVDIATDGETYGHHHRFGDMALAYALHYIEQNELAAITNYGQFLELHPPEHEVEIAERTAWSCAHGVERWRSDCGCNTGAGPGWNQQWRTPLRDALDWLRDETAALFEREGGKLLRDPWAARDDYIDVVLDRSDASVDAFLARHTLADASTTRVLQLLEMQRNAMLMYTSCGWFFNDISGIETVQVLHYAARVVQLALQAGGRDLEPALIERLAAAQSNLPERGTARDIYVREVIPTRLDLSRVAAHYAVASLFDSFPEDVQVYCYRVRQLDYATDRAGRARMAVGSITVQSTVTREEAAYDFAVLHLGETELTGGVRPADDDYDEVKRLLLKTMQPGGIPAVIRLLDQRVSATQVSIRSLFRDEQRRILNLLCNSTLEEAESAFRQLHERYDPLMRFHTRLGIPLPKVLQTAAEFDLNLQLRRLLEGEPLPVFEIETRLREAREERVGIDEQTRLTIMRAIERVSTRFRQRPASIERLDELHDIVAMVRSMQIAVDLRKAQNDYYAMRAGVRPSMTANARWLELFDDLGAKLSIAPEAGGNG
jgi:alpha-amylase/alpha-mannosidase (GH57 family)